MSARAWLCAICLSPFARPGPCGCPLARIASRPRWDDDPSTVFALAGELVAGRRHAFDLAGGNHGNCGPGVRFEKGKRGLASPFSGNIGESVASQESTLTDTSPSPCGRTNGRPRRDRVQPATEARRAALRVYPRAAGLPGYEPGVESGLAPMGSASSSTPRSLAAVLTHDVPIAGWVHVAVVYSKGTPTLYIGARR